MRGEGGPCPNFCPLFTHCIYWVNLRMGTEGETPAQIFWYIGAQKKWYKLSTLGGGWGNLDKIQKNSYFFRKAFPYRQMLYHCIISSSTCRQGRARVKGLAAHRLWLENRNFFSWLSNAPTTSSQTSCLRQSVALVCTVFYLFYSFLFLLNLFLYRCGRE